MNYYENKILQDRESHLIGAGISFVLMSPLLALAIGAVLGSATGMVNIFFYGTWAVVLMFGVLSIVTGIKEKINRKRNQKN